MYRVIIADDEEKICKLIQILVDWEAKGLEIAGVAHDGREALELVKEQGADIIITDIRMPELNGLDLVEAIKNARPDISCVIISGYQEFEYARRALQYGVEEYLLKPIREEELNRVLDEIISKKDLIRQEFEEKAAMEITSSEQKKKMHKLLVRNLAEENQDLRGKTREVLEKEYYCSLPGSASVLFGVKVHMFSEPGGHEGLTLALNQWEQAAADCPERPVYRHQRRDADYDRVLYIRIPEAGHRSADIDGANLEAADRRRCYLSAGWNTDPVTLNIAEIGEEGAVPLFLRPKIVHLFQTKQTRRRSLHWPPV